MVKTIKRFTASWCAPCRAYAPIFEEVSKMEEYKDVDFKVVDVDDANATETAEMQKFQIRGIPATVFLDENNELLSKEVGALPKQTLIQVINGLL